MALLTCAQCDELLKELGVHLERRLERREIRWRCIILGDVFYEYVMMVGCLVEETALSSADHERNFSPLLVAASF
jgi:hypothetical protein